MPTFNDPVQVTLPDPATVGTQSASITFGDFVVQKLNLSQGFEGIVHVVVAEALEGPAQRVEVRGVEGGFARDVPQVLQALEDPGEGVGGIEVAQDERERRTGAREGHGERAEGDRHVELREAVAVGRLTGQVRELGDREGLRREGGIIEPNLHRHRRHVGLVFVRRPGLRAERRGVRRRRDVEDVRRIEDVRVVGGGSPRAPARVQILATESRAWT